ncbi:hypothetical protein [Lentzea sp. NBRC 102530]|uniref:hypothetical protein n=1 Tax=Lentzea sp. NBRC 102530 TaxID=3032201 RepID=UPI0024A104DD|nr:hypothetical protein [Lentzea sp. NBRC 102530]GLY48406.1 hypothetical protein Lesp01_20620 [Lentzea sp. NBRC 102530]
MFLELLISCASVGVVALAVVVLRRLKNRHVRQDELWFMYRRHMDELREVSPEAELARVAEVYQRAKRGTKARIVWERTGVAQDSWFEGMTTSPGDLLLLRGGPGWGPDVSSPNVFYVAPGQVLSSMTVAAQTAADRHHSLSARAAAKQ